MTKTHNGITYHFFWGGMFSNWFPSDFTVDGVEYNCGEQYMMVCKAKLFHDKKTELQIMAETNPADQKKLGRRVKNYNDAEWAKVRYEQVKRGLKEKFLQNQEFKHYLLQHKGCVIVEASPYDRIWGIGYNDRDAIANMNNWGENLLGKILTELSNELS